jgi:hypothetical protein
MLSAFALLTPIAIVVYVLYLRPIAAARFKLLYYVADGFWSKVWALCGRSYTLAAGYVVQFFGFLFQMIDPVAELFGDPELKQQIADGLQANPKVLGVMMSVISAVVIVARLVSLFKRI